MLEYIILRRWMTSKARRWEVYEPPRGKGQYIGNTFDTMPAAVREMRKAPRYDAPDEQWEYRVVVIPNPSPRRPRSGPRK